MHVNLIGPGAKILQSVCDSVRPRRAFSIGALLVKLVNKVEDPNVVYWN